jgi:glycosyltransferase involved in cell wall biosynthesis
VLLVVKSNGFGGVERKVRGLVDVFGARGVECDVVTLSADAGRGGLVDPLPRIVLDDGGRGGVIGRLRQLRQLRRLARRRHYTAMVGFGPSANALVALTRRPRGPRAVVAEVGDPFIARRRGWNRGWMWVYPLADVLVVQTGRLATEFAAIHRRPRRIVVIPNMVPPAVPRVRADTPREHVIAGVGRLVASKRFEDLIEACARLAPAIDGWSIVIVGDGPERGRLVALAAARGLEGRVTIRGWDDAPWETLARASIFVQCSAHEGFPTALLEAIASGCAVVASDCRFGPREILGEENAELLYPVGDVDALVGVVRRLVDDPARRLELAEAAARRLDQFTTDAITARWLDVLGAAPCG